MRICLVGIEPAVAKYCRTAVEELAASGCEVIESETSGELPEADAYIREFRNDSAVFAETRARTLFLVSPHNLPQLRATLGPARACILLKPAHPAAIRPFLEHLISGERPDGEQVASGSESEELLDALLAMTLKLQDHEKARSNFLARAVHDFRAPLTALGGYCGLLLEQSLGTLNPVQLDLLRRMEHSVKRMSRLAEAIFEFSAGRQPGMDLRLQRGDMEGAIAQAIHEITPRADEKQIRLTTALSEPETPLIFDPGKIEQVLVNLLENACKFTPRRGTIEISGYPFFWDPDSKNPPQPGAEATGETLSEEEPNAYRVDVRDSGAGIPEERLESIFEEYTSYGGGADRSGAGLGLAICRMIVEEHRGCIWAESSRPGARFSFVLPYGRTLRKSRIAANAVTRRAEASLV